MQEVPKNTTKEIKPEITLVHAHKSNPEEHIFKRIRVVEKEEKMSLLQLKNQLGQTKYDIARLEAIKADIEQDILDIEAELNK